MTMQLHRVFQNGVVALGVLRDDDGTQFFTTFEDKPIPAGTYTVRFMPPEANPKHGACWEVQAVPGRTDILFHVGNDEHDSDGCILVGLAFASTGRAIAASRVGYTRLLRYLRGLSTFTLVITDVNTAVAL